MSDTDDADSADLTVRPFESEDHDQAWTVHLEALRESALDFDRDKVDDDLIAIQDRCRSAGGEFFVGLHEGTIVAIGGYQPKDADSVEIRRMRVHPTYQGRGFGRRLLTTLENRAVDAGFDRAVLYTLECLIAARRLYESAGYEEFQRELHPATGDDMIYYEKRLGSGASN